MDDDSPKPSPPLRVICIDTQPCDNVISLLEDSPDLRYSTRQPENRLSPVSMTRPPTVASAMMRTLLARYGALPQTEDSAKTTLPLPHVVVDKQEPIHVPAEEHQQESVFTFSTPPEVQCPPTPATYNFAIRLKHSNFNLC